jgi:hypothetical protein
VAARKRQKSTGSPIRLGIGPRALDASYGSSIFQVVGPDADDSGCLHVTARESMIMSIIFPGDDLTNTLGNLERLHSDLSRIRNGEGPTDEELKSAPILNRWQAGFRFSPCVFGQVFGHPILGDQRTIHTSELFAIDTLMGWARTWSRFYRLGMPNGGFQGGGNA